MAEGLALHDAARYGKLEDLKRALANAPGGINERGCCSGQKETKTKQVKRTPLSWASEFGHDTCVLFLLESGAKVEIASTKGHKTALCLACEFNHAKCAALLLQHGAKADSVGEAHLWVNTNPLMMGCRFGADECIAPLLEAGVNMDKWYPIMHSKYGGDVYTSRLSHCTPLGIACSYGHDKCAAHLIRAGAKINLVGVANSDEGHSALMHAAGYGHDKCVHMLLGAGATIDLRDRYGLTALMLACKYGHATSAKLLLEAGANPSLRATPMLLCGIPVGRRLTARDLAKVDIEVVTLLDEWLKKNTSTSSTSPALPNQV